MALTDKMIQYWCVKIWLGAPIVKKLIVKSDWRDGFLFLGNQRILDFLNTRPVQDGEPRELLPDFDALLRWCQADGFLTPGDLSKMRQQWGDSSRALQTLEAARDLRERLRKEILVWEARAAIHAAIVDELNRLMAEHPLRTRLKQTRAMLAQEPWFKFDEPEDLFGPLAHSAADLFSSVDRTRVRKCEQCVLHFHDTSKKGTRRWCSMQLCGNRSKVAAYAARRRAH